MKIIYSFLAVCFILIGSGNNLFAQCSCNQTRLQNIMDNVDIKLVASHGSNTPVSSINPGTTYYLRVQATSHICEQSGSGCSGINAPVAFYVDLADGCTVFGDFVPPRVGLDVGSSNNFTTYFAVQTLTGGNFLDQLYFRIRAGCFPSPSCNVLIGGTKQALLP